MISREAVCGESRPSPPQPDMGRSLPREGSGKAGAYGPSRLSQKGSRPTGQCHDAATVASVRSNTATSLQSGLEVTGGSLLAQGVAAPFRAAATRYLTVGASHSRWSDSESV